MFVLAIFTNYSQYKIISFSSNEIDYYEFLRIYIIMKYIFGIIQILEIFTFT